MRLEECEKRKPDLLLGVIPFPQSQSEDRTRCGSPVDPSCSSMWCCCTSTTNGCPCDSCVIHPQNNRPMRSRVTIITNASLPNLSCCQSKQAPYQHYPVRSNKNKSNDQRH
eukprot:12923653-Prorocentrum_lima.AAC.1